MKKKSKLPKAKQVKVQSRITIHYTFSTGKGKKPKRWVESTTWTEPLLMTDGTQPTIEEEIAAIKKASQ